MRAEALGLSQGHDGNDSAARDSGSRGRCRLISFIGPDLHTPEMLPRVELVALGNTARGKVRENTHGKSVLEVNYVTTGRTEVCTMGGNKMIFQRTTRVMSVPVAAYLNTTQTALEYKGWAIVGWWD